MFGMVELGLERSFPSKLIESMWKSLYTVNPPEDGGKSGWYYFVDIVFQQVASLVCHGGAIAKLMGRLGVMQRTVNSLLDIRHVEIEG